MDFFHYLVSGIRHVIPNGFDHILFMVCIFLSGKNWQEVLRGSILFTIAHSIALWFALSLRGVSTVWAEQLIPLTILCSALNIMLDFLPNKSHKILVVLFGLIHGFGFARAFIESGENKAISSVLFFNFGVELAQLSIIGSCLLLFSIFTVKGKQYKQGIVYGMASSIALISMWWFWHS